MGGAILYSLTKPLFQFPDAAALRHSGSPNIDPYHSQAELRVQLGEVGSLACKIYNVANRWAERERR